MHSAVVWLHSKNNNAAAEQNMELKWQHNLGHKGRFRNKDELFYSLKNSSFPGLQLIVVICFSQLFD